MHNIKEHDNLFLGSGTDAWHYLGTTVQGQLTAADALKTAKLDWQVGLAPAYALIEGVYVPVSDKYHTYRLDNGLVLGTVGDRYVPVQNDQLFGFLDKIVDSGEAHYETAGSLKNCKVVWILLQPDENEITIGGDPFRKYLLGRTTHDGSGAVIVKPVVTRVVCDNTLGWAEREVSNTFTARHTASATGRVQEAREALDIGFAYFDAFEETVKQLQAVEVELDEFERIVADLVPIEDGLKGRSLTIREKSRDSIRQQYALTDPFTGTGWGVVQAVNGFEQWDQTVRGGDRAERQAFNTINGHAPLTNKARELVLVNN